MKKLLLCFVLPILFISCKKNDSPDYEEIAFEIINQFYNCYNIEDFNILISNSNITSFFVYNEGYIDRSLTFEQQYHPVSTQIDESLSRIIESKKKLGNFNNYQIKDIKYYRILPAKGYSNVYIVYLETDYQHIKTEEEFMLTLNTENRTFNIVEFEIVNIQIK